MNILRFIYIVFVSYILFFIYGYSIYDKPSIQHLHIKDKMLPYKMKGLANVVIIANDSSTYQSMYVDYLRLTNIDNDSLVFAQYYRNLKNGRDSSIFEYYQIRVLEHLSNKKDSLVYENYLHKGFFKFKVGVPFIVNE